MKELGLSQNLPAFKKLQEGDVFQGVFGKCAMATKIIHFISWLLAEDLLSISSSVGGKLFINIIMRFNLLIGIRFKKSIGGCSNESSLEGKLLQNLKVNKIN